jgi:hypothetical protein
VALVLLFVPVVSLLRFTSTLSVEEKHGAKYNKGKLFDEQQSL